MPMLRAIYYCNITPSSSLRSDRMRCFGTVVKYLLHTIVRKKWIEQRVSVFPNRTLYPRPLDRESSYPRLQKNFWHASATIQFIVFLLILRVYLSEIG